MNSGAHKTQTAESDAIVAGLEQMAMRGWHIAAEPEQLLTEAANYITAVSAHVKALEAALAPFANVKLLKPSIADEEDSVKIEEVRLSGFAVEGATDYLPVMAFRRARTLLTHGEGK